MLVDEKGTGMPVSLSKVITTGGIAACLAAAFAIVKVLRIGPVIFVVSESHGWGVHTGDFLALVPLGIALLLWLRR